MQKYNTTPERNNEQSEQIDNIIIGMTILYGHPAVLFKHAGGYAWKYKDEITDLGNNISKERAIEKFEWNFRKCL